MDIELNKKNAIAFYKMAYDGDPEKAIELYVGNEYIQHKGHLTTRIQFDLALFGLALLSFT